MYHVRFALFQTVSAAAVVVDDFGLVVVDSGEVADFGEVAESGTLGTDAEDFGFASEDSGATTSELDSREITSELLELSPLHDANSTPDQKATADSTNAKNAVAEYRICKERCIIAHGRTKAEKSIFMDVPGNVLRFFAIPFKKVKKWRKFFHEGEKNID